MNKAEKLREKYLSDLEDLQLTCTHKESTDWMRQEWAPGHSSGYELKVCTECNVITAQRPSEKLPITIITPYIVLNNE